ncbi:hypothetical protein [Mariniflexile sp. AS56]|uniref:hypothetical protein n=1 Tax=Mariniflexile sp. AS56 TaxID=3063957 RepID=UPI0026EA2AD8|nr:hypothetical protein [Mariniflexile sp. AS56]MDO7173151.1 hypothetical protein [Mariniflexile sp. AS56]
MKNLITVFLLVLANSLFSQSVVIPADSNFYNPDIKSYKKTISEPSKATNHSQLIQDAIDEVAKKGGGILTIGASKNNNNYVINTEVELKSGVHIRVDPKVVFTTTSPKKTVLFSVGKNGTNRITNFSMSCTDSKSFFTFDFSNRQGGKSTTDFGVIAIALGGVQNFRIADFKVIDNFTPFSAITVNLLGIGKGKYLFAHDGIIEHLQISKGHYGYGLIQCQAAINVLYRNLNGEGGATLRLETGAIGKAYLTDKSIKIDQVYGKNIVCKNGQAAITLSPHTIINGKIFVDDLTAVSCEAGAIVASGFLSAKKGQKDKNGAMVEGYELGSFDSNSVISNLKVIYGTDAQLRGSRRAFVPCSQRNLINPELNIDGESYHGPTITGIMYYAKGGTDLSQGFYTVNTPGLVLQNFPVANGKMVNKEFIASSKESINGCDITWDKENSKSETKEIKPKKGQNKGKKKKKQDL